jgi:hypothetical protein
LLLRQIDAEVGDKNSFKDELDSLLEEDVQGWFDAYATTFVYRFRYERQTRRWNELMTK